MTIFDVSVEQLPLLPPPLVVSRPVSFDRIYTLTDTHDAYLLYLNHQHGYDLSSMRKTLDDKDRRTAVLEAQVAERDKRIETIIEYERQKGGRQ